ncbi:uncharacterized protein LOC123529619 [Mercenaria mercenaria]|uniref:uncharacterized protein LOC123529619 n=1 Tax=Mercenaria mercenaria TaxID=6596 RepID=UPI001E1D6396|nr:uncharacterized protein LOC123529619 [Mercenaria mercenaria]
MHTLFPEVNKMRCSNSSCGIEGSDRFCMECGCKMVEVDKTVTVICKGKLEDGLSCLSELVPGQNFCMKCGIKVDQALFNTEKTNCSNCNSRLVSGQRFCGDCGLNLHSAGSNCASPMDRSVLSINLKEKLSLIRKRRLNRCSKQTGESLSMKKSKNR